MRRLAGLPLQMWAFFVVLIGEVFLYIQLLRLFLSVFASWSDVGSNFIAFWILAIVPGALVFGAIVGVLHAQMIRKQPEQYGTFVATIWATNVALLIGSMAYYTIQLHR